MKKPEFTKRRALYRALNRLREEADLLDRENFDELAEHLRALFVPKRLRWFVYVWASGLITIEKKYQDGALAVYVGRKDVCKALVLRTSRLGYGEDEYLCPGVPEAVASGDQDAALEAVRGYRSWLQSYHG